MVGKLRRARRVTLECAGGRELHQQLALRRRSLRQRERRQVVLLLEREPGLVGDRERVREDVRTVAEVLADFRRALEVEAAVILHAVVVEPVFLQADAEQHVVRIVIFGAQEVRVVRGDDRKVQLLREPEHFRVELLLLARLVRLHLEVIAVLEDVRVPLRGLLCVVEPVLEKMPRHLARHACGRHDDPLIVLFEQLAIHTRLAVESLGVRERRELDQVLVPDPVAREEDQVVV